MRRWGPLQYFKWNYFASRVRGPSWSSLWLTCKKIRSRSNRRVLAHQPIIALLFTSSAYWSRPHATTVVDRQFIAVNFDRVAARAQLLTRHVIVESVFAESVFCWWGALLSSHFLLSQFFCWVSFCWVSSSVYCCVVWPRTLIYDNITWCHPTVKCTCTLRLYMCRTAVMDKARYCRDRQLQAGFRLLYNLGVLLLSQLLKIATWFIVSFLLSHFLLSHFIVVNRQFIAVNFDRGAHTVAEGLRDDESVCWHSALLLTQCYWVSFCWQGVILLSQLLKIATWFRVSFFCWDWRVFAESESLLLSQTTTNWSLCWQRGRRIIAESVFADNYIIPFGWLSIMFFMFQPLRRGYVLR